MAGRMLSPASGRPILQTPARPHTKLCPAPVLSFSNGILMRPLPQWMTRSSDPQVRAPEVRGQSAPPAPLAAVSGPPWARQPVPTGPGVAQVPVDPSRDCSCPGWVSREGLSFQSRETVEEEASPSPCPGDLGTRVGRAVCYPDQAHRLELEEEPRAGSGQISASDLPGPEPSRHPPAFGQWGRTSWSAPWPAAGVQFCVPAWWDRVGTATLGPQFTCQEDSVLGVGGLSMCLGVQ